MKTSFAFAAAMSLAVAILAAPTARAQDNPATPDPAVADSGFGDPALLAAAAAPPQTVAPADVLKMIDGKRSDVALVDTQPTSGYAEEHIPGAINYPWVMQIKQFPIALPRNKTLIFYGSCPNDTSDIVKQLAEYGYFNVKIMDGGLYKWVALRYPVAGTNAAPAIALAQVADSHDKSSAAK